MSSILTNVAATIPDSILKVRERFHLPPLQLRDDDRSRVELFERINGQIFIDRHEPLGQKTIPDLLATESERLSA